jgi:hypothetical protein
VRCTGQSGNVTIQFATVPRDVRVNDSFGDVTLLLPDSSTPYHVSTRNPFGSTNVSVLTSPAAADTITVNDNSGNIAIGYPDSGSAP